ncbi:hypothetical protein AX15_006457 [Amanita polypyramis BW_CC]|nr:hypothetical protein AX15_006457 [Amanita polypyramis BW_CC]
MSPTVRFHASVRQCVPPSPPGKHSFDRHIQTHSQCSESFYRKELETDVHSAPSKSREERQKMLELLKKFEEESMDDDVNDLIDEGEYGNKDPAADLETRLQNIDLHSAEPDQLWSLLSAEERSKFLKALQDPDSELAQQLLSSAELEKSRQKPWWEESDIEDEDASWTTRPEPILVPASMIKSVPSPPSLVYNMCAIGIAYAFIVRHLAISSFSKLQLDDPDRKEAQRMMSQLVPFLTEKRSMTRFSSLSEVIIDIWPRFEEGEVTSKILATLLQDCASLMRPLLVTAAAVQPLVSKIDPRFHPHCIPVLILSDINVLFSRPGQGTGVGLEKSNANHVARKLLFYASHILSMPPRIFQLVVSELATRARNIHEEGEWVQQAKAEDQQAIKLNLGRQAQNQLAYTTDAVFERTSDL